MDVGTVADELYGLPREEFVAARDARAREARAAGRDRAAEEIGRLRKPTMAAWLANLLSREQPGEVQGLVRLGESLRKAHREVAGAALRQLSQQRHELVHALVTQTRGLGRREGHRVSDAVGEELREIITAALTDLDAARASSRSRRCRSRCSARRRSAMASSSWAAFRALPACGFPAAGFTAAGFPAAGFPAAGFTGVAGASAAGQDRSASGCTSWTEVRLTRTPPAHDSGHRR